jgi:hypothetical protein
MPRYLIEVYVARTNADEARAGAGRARAAARGFADTATPVRYVRMTHLPDDETCFHVVDAPSAEAARELSRRAALGAARIVAAIE